MSFDFWDEAGIERMKEHYEDIKDWTEGYRSLGISYRLLKSNLIEREDPAEAEQYKRKERSALMHYYFVCIPVYLLPVESCCPITR